MGPSTGQLQDPLEMIVHNTFFPAAHPGTEGHTGDPLNFSANLNLVAIVKKDEKAVLSHCSVPTGLVPALPWSVAVGRLRAGDPLLASCSGINGINVL